MIRLSRASLSTLPPAASIFNWVDLKTVSLRPSNFVRSLHVAAPTKQETAKSNDVEAQKWFDMLPGADAQAKANNFVFGLSAGAILFGKEIIPYTGDVVYALPFGTAVWFLMKQAGPMLKDVIGQVEKEEAKIWEDSKTKAVTRLESEIHQITGSGITELTDVTKSLFEHAKEVAQLEAQAFEHEQMVAYHTKAKQILDEWVRHEAAIREREQKLIAEQVIARVNAAIADPKFQDRYLEQCISDIETALA